MAEQKKNAKPKKGGTETGTGKARSQTIELTATDVTPPESDKAKAAASKSAADKTAAKDAASSPAGSGAKPKPEDKATDAPAARGGGIMAYALSGLFGGAVALIGAAVLVSFQMIDLSGSAGQRSREGLGALDKRLQTTLAEVQSQAGQRDAAIAALKGDAAKAGSRSSVHEDMIGKTAASVNEIKTGLKAASGQLTVSADKLNRLTASLASVEKRIESVSGSIGSLGAKLESESEARTGLGPRIAANGAMLEKRGSDINRLMQWQDAVSAENRKLGARMASLLAGLKDIERSVADASAAGGGEPSSAGVRLALLDRKIQRLGKDIAGLSATLQSLPAVPPDLSPQIIVLEKTVARFDKGFALSGQRYAALQDNVRKLDERLRDLGLMAGRMQAINTRIDEVKSRSAEQGKSMRLLQSAARVLGLGEDGTSKALTGLDQRLGGLQSEIAGKLAALEKAMSGFSEAEAKLAGVDVRLESVKSAQAELAAMQQKAAKEQAASRLRRDLLSGSAYTEALAGFVSLAPKVIVPQSVQDSAHKGLPSQDMLRTKFADIRASIDAAGVVKSEDGLMGRLMKSAGSVVSIRRTGPVSGSSPSAIASRIDDYLAKGELGLAVREAEGYEGVAADKLQDWVKLARSRFEAEKFAADVMALAMTGSEQG